MYRLLFIISWLFTCYSANSQTCSKFLSALKNRHSNPPWTTEKIVSVIMALKAADLPLYGDAVKQGGEVYQKIVTDTLGYPGSLKRLVESKPEPGWTWSLALKKAGLDPVVERAYKKPWSVDEIIKLIKAFHAKGLPVNRVSVASGGEEYQRVVKKLLGRRVSLDRMVNVKPVKGWSWELALSKAGLNPGDHILKKHLWTEKEITKLIQRFYDKGLKLNLNSVRNGGPEYDAVMLEVMGFSNGTQGIVNAKPVKGWSWDMALVKAGFNPNEIRLRGSAAFYLLTETMREEFGARYEHFYGSGQYAFQSFAEGVIERIAVENKTAEDILGQKQYVDALENLTHQMIDREQEILNGMIEYMETNKDLDLDSLFVSLQAQLDNLNFDEIQGVFIKIRKDPQIINLFLNL